MVTINVRVVVTLQKEDRVWDESAAPILLGVTAVTLVWMAVELGFV